MFNRISKKLTLLAVFLGALLTLQTQIFADVGDIGIYRDIAGGQDEDNQSWHDEIFDEIVHEDTTEFTQDGGDVLITLDQGGHYFVWYSLNFISTSGGGTDDRTVHISRIDVNGAPLEAGYAQGYIRAEASELQAYISGGAIIEVSSGSDLKIEAINMSNNTGEAIETRGNLNGVTLLKLDDDWDYLRIHESTGGTNYNFTAMTSYTWDTTDEIDSNSFSYTNGNSNITLEEAGHYLLTYSIRLDRNSDSRRMQMVSQVTLGGTPQEHCHSGTYIRGNLAGDIIENGAISGVCIVEATAGQDLVVQLARRSASVGTTITDVGDESALTLVKLPDTADYILVHDDDGTQTVDTSNEPLLWNTQDEVDSAFTHDDMTNSGTIGINEDGHYLFTSCLHADRVTSNQRYPYINQWRVDNTTQKYGAFGAYNRGENGTYDAWESSNCGALILDDMIDGQELVLTVTDEGGSNGAANEPQFVANEMGLTGVYLDSLFVDVKGTTDLANGTTLRLAVNGDLLSAQSDVSGGAFSITVGADHITSGTIVTVWADAVTTANETTAVTKYDGTGDITGMVLNKHVLTIGSNDNASLTIDDLGLYDNDGTASIMHFRIAEH